MATDMSIGAADDCVPDGQENAANIVDGKNLGFEIQHEYTSRPNYQKRNSVFGRRVNVHTSRGIMFRHLGLQVQAQRVKIDAIFSPNVQSLHVSAFDPKLNRPH